MVRVSQEKRIEDYYKIYEQISENPTITILELSEKIKRSRNTTPKFLREMYAKNVLIGPYIKMKSISDYREYVYVMNFSDPFFIFKGLKEFPHVVYHAITSGSWNTFVVTDRHLDLPKLVGFQSVLYQGVKVRTSTPKVEYNPWDESIERIDQVAQRTPVQADYKGRSNPLPDWGKNEWKLFHAFKRNLRQKRTPIFHKIKVKSNVYIRWMNTLKDYCTIHAEFYPHGRERSMRYCFLISSESAIESYFSNFPIMCPIIRVEGKKNRFLLFPAVDSIEGIKKLYFAICKMKTKGIIEEFSYAAILEDFFHSCK